MQHEAAVVSAAGGAVIAEAVGRALSHPTGPGAGSGGGDGAAVVVCGQGTDRQALETEIARLRRTSSTRRVIVLADRGRRDLAELPAELLDLDTSVEDLRRAVAEPGGASAPRPASPRPSAPRGDQVLIASLTERERHVLALLVEGRRSPEMAAELAISPHTLRTHVQNVLGKLGVNSRLEAVALALRAGLRPERGRPRVGATT